MKINLFVLLSFLVTSVGLQAQETVPVAGGIAAGSGGTSSYTVGQTVYITNTGISGSVAQGVQQPFEISILTGINETTINLEIAVYPNPTSKNLQLKVESGEIESLVFQLMDFQGKIIEENNVLGRQTTISMEALPKAIYFFNVIRNNKAVKTFKVIKQ